MVFKSKKEIKAKRWEEIELEGLVGLTGEERSIGDDMARWSNTYDRTDLSRFAGGNFKFRDQRSRPGECALPDQAHGCT